MSKKVLVLGIMNILLLFTCSMLFLTSHFLAVICRLCEGRSTWFGMDISINFFVDLTLYLGIAMILTIVVLTIIIIHLKK